jgi:hypothetical protein
MPFKRWSVGCPCCSGSSSSIGGVGRGCGVCSGLISPTIVVSVCTGIAGPYCGTYTYTGDGAFGVPAGLPAGVWARVDQLTPAPILAKIIQCAGNGQTLSDWSSTSGFSFSLGWTFDPPNTCHHITAWQGFIGGPQTTGFVADM